MRWLSLFLVLLFSGCVPNEPATKKKAPQGEAKSKSADKKKKKRKASSKASKPTKPKLDIQKRREEAKQDPQLDALFADDFERRKLGDDWRPSSPAWRIQNGKLCVRGARNQPLWLKRRLPENAQIEFTATSDSPDGDIKVELWGNGFGAATKSTYDDASSYIAIFGGWKNTYHVLARLDEHAKDRPELKLKAGADDPRLAPVEAGHEYFFKIERRDGKTIRWLVDDIELFQFEDKAPLKGPEHDHFAFNNWQVRLCFDKLKIRPL